MIAKVEPLTHPPARFADRSTTCSRIGSPTSRSGPCCGSRSAHGGSSASSSRSPSASALDPERLAEPIEALEAGAPPDLVRLGLWVGARVLLDSRPAGSSSSCRLVRRRPAVRPRALPPLTRDGRPRRDRCTRHPPAGLGPRQRRALDLLASSRPDGVSAAALAGEGVRPRRPAPARAPRAGRASPARELRSPAALDVDRAPPTARSPLSAEQRSRDRADHRRARRRRRSELLLSTVSPVRARPRSTSRRPRPRSSAGAGRSPRPGDRPDAAGGPAGFSPRFTERVAVLHSGLGAGERRDQWHRLRAGEARSASARARRSSLRSPPSG